MIIVNDEPNIEKPPKFREVDDSLFADKIRSVSIKVVEDDGTTHEMQVMIDKKFVSLLRDPGIIGVLNCQTDLLVPHLAQEIALKHSPRANNEQ